MYFVVENVLSATDLERARELVQKARFIDGRATSTAKSRKSNGEMEVGEHYVALVELLNRAVEASRKLNMRMLPRFRTNPIINRYDTGGFYGEHIDAPIQGGVNQIGRSPGRFGQNFIRTDYSMTLFLSNPESYDGGELELGIFEDREAADVAICEAAAEVVHAQVRVWMDDTSLVRRHLDG